MLIRKYTTVDGVLKKLIVVAVEQVSIYPLADQLTGYGQMSALIMLKHLFSSYGEIDEINLEENAVKMMGPYDPAEPLSQLIEQL